MSEDKTPYKDGGQSPEQPPDPLRVVVNSEGDRILLSVTGSGTYRLSVHDAMRLSESLLAAAAKRTGRPAQGVGVLNMVKVAEAYIECMSKSVKACLGKSCAVSVAMQSNGDGVFLVGGDHDSDIKNLLHHLTLHARNASNKLSRERGG